MDVVTIIIALSVGSYPIGEMIRFSRNKSDKG
jgi:hypothetical protein